MDLKFVQNYLFMDTINEYKKMERSALKVFLSMAGVIYAFGVWYSFSTGNTLAGGLLLTVVVLLAGFVAFTTKNKTE